MGTWITIGVGVIIAIFVIAFLCMIYKVVPPQQALVITGGKKPIIKVSGGSFVIPIFRKATTFDLGMLTVSADKDEIKTKTSVPIVVDWTAQIRPNASDLEALRKAIISFKEKGKNGIIEDVGMTLMGSVRSVVATMTPEQVQNEKELFAKEIRENVADELTEMGLELVSLNIQDINDNNGYFANIAALDMAEKEKEAQNKLSIVSQDVRRQKAESEKIARQNELESELQIAEKTKDNALKKAAFKTETDKAVADAEVAGQIQSIIRQKEIESEKGSVEIVKQEQANLAALKKQEVEKTKAETDKVKAKIAADQQAEVASIEADAKANVWKKEAEGNATAVKIEAAAEAEAKKTKAEGIKAEGEAQAEVTKQKGLAEVEIIKQKGLAEAEAERARLLAQAEGEKALAEARSGNDKVNFEIEKLKIEWDAKIQISKNNATIMADLGKNAEFININGGNSDGKSNAMFDALERVPQMVKMLDVQNQALNGESFNDTVSKLGESIIGPAKGLLVNNEKGN